MYERYCTFTHAFFVRNFCYPFIGGLGAVYRLLDTNVLYP